MTLPEMPKVRFEGNLAYYAWPGKLLVSQEVFAAAVTHFERQVVDQYLQVYDPYPPAKVEVDLDLVAKRCAEATGTPATDRLLDNRLPRAYRRAPMARLLPPRSEAQARAEFDRVKALFQAEHDEGPLPKKGASI